ncbi:hypothetical protein ASF47_18775 [Nocardioides sp. Leaf285]|nr:hypothetical protein ASF47_18775 [Nocardioides sp. Leaf285]
MNTQDPDRQPGPDAPGAQVEPTPSTGSALGEAPALQQRRALAEARAEAMRKTQEIEAMRATVKADIEAKKRALEADLAEQLAAMRAQMEPLEEQIRQLSEASWTINLYLGRDEQIVALRDNQNLQPAGADAPLTLRQAVLSMDEETAAYAEQGGIDARHLEAFDAWIAEPANLDRVLPEQRGVVALVPRAKGRDYQDPWMNEAMRKENAWTYFLLRNGERVWRMKTDFVVGKRLIPATDEFTGLFTNTRWDPVAREHRTEPLTPGTPEWDAADKRQGARERHFMRMALILQGLVDRTTCFAPLPPHGLNLLDQRTYDDGHAVLVRDAEAVLTDGRPDFYTWLASKTADLRVGMRVLGAFNTDTFRTSGGEYRHNDREWSPHDRITPRPRSYWATAEKPTSGVLYRLESKKTDRGVTGFVFKFEQSKRWIDDNLGRGEYRTPKTRATCLVAPGDRFILPFDLVTVEECRYYLDARSQRAAYEEMFPLLRATIAAKEAEVAQEAPFRRLLATALSQADPTIDATDPDLAQAHRVLDPLVDWWKFTNKHHRALTGQPEHEAKAIRDIVAEHRRRTATAATQSGDAAAEAAMVARLLDPAQGGDPAMLVIARKRDGSYLAFAPQPRTYPAGTVGHPATNRPQPASPTDAERAANAALHPVRRRDADDLDNLRMIPAAVADNVYAVEYTATKTGRSVKSRTWVQPGSRLDNARILHTSDDWERFDLHADPNEHLTDPEIDAVLAEIVPEVEHNARSGWPSKHRVNGSDEDPFEPLILGVCLRTEPGDYGQGPHFQVHLIDAAEPQALATAPSALADNSASTPLMRVDVYFTKTRRGLTLHRSEHSGTFALTVRPEGSTYSTATADRPWHYYWSKRARHAIALVEYPDNGAVAAQRQRRVERHNARVRYLRSLATDPLVHAKRAADAAVEAVAYARFLEDFADPALWEGHRKSLRASDLEASWHYQGRRLPEQIYRVLYMAADADMITPVTFRDPTWDTPRSGHQIAGHTVASLMGTLGLADPSDPSDVEALTPFLDLPLHPRPEDVVTPEEIAAAAAEPEHAATPEPDPASDPTGETDREAGPVVLDDGTIVMSATVVSDEPLTEPDDQS